jgi:hypothetical protein
MDDFLPQLHQRLASLNAQLDLTHNMVRVELDYYLNFQATSKNGSHEWSVLLNSLDAVFILNAFGKCYSASNASQLFELILTSLQGQIASTSAFSGKTPWSGSSGAGHSFSPI